MKTFLPLVMTMFISTAFAQSRLSTDIVDTAVGAGSFKTLVVAVQAANLVETLKSPGPFTVFAPTDSAFAKLPPGTIDVLLNNIPQLTKILTYHVVAGEYSADELIARGTIKTVQGQRLNIREKRSGKVTYVYVNNSIVEDSLFVKNGVIHVVDTVLMPK